MKVWLTGGGGFVGSNVARVFAEHHGAEVCAPTHAELDVTDGSAVRLAVEAFAPDAIVHGAILNDFDALYSRRREAWDVYVGATRSLVDAANAVGAQFVFISTDWVFDGTQGAATEDEPPNPINAYGFLKAAGELVVTERADRGAVARIAGVAGVHWARVGANGVAREQDAGLGYLVVPLVKALRAGRTFTVWQSSEINEIATPTLASDAAQLLWRLVDRGLGGTFHCCGGETVHRVELARRAVAHFDLDPALLRTGPPDPRALPPAPVPHDTSLDATATATRLGVTLPDLETMLARLGHEIDAGEPAAWEPAASPTAPQPSADPPGGGTPWV
jgi:dTDP-4-dehydrorhamnose reductase